MKEESITCITMFIGIVSSSSYRGTERYAAEPLRKTVSFTKMLVVGSSGGLCAPAPPTRRQPKAVRPFPKVLIALHRNLSPFSSHVHRQHATVTSFQTSRTYNEPSNPIPLFGADYRPESSRCPPSNTPLSPLALAPAPQNQHSQPPRAPRYLGELPVSELKSESFAKSCDLQHITYNGSAASAERKRGTRLQQPWVSPRPQTFSLSVVRALRTTSSPAQPAPRESLLARQEETGHCPW